jgi:hypothetical protein
VRRIYDIIKLTSLQFSCMHAKIARGRTKVKVKVCQAEDECRANVLFWHCHGHLVRQINNTSRGFFDRRRGKIMNDKGFISFE